MVHSQNKILLIVEGKKTAPNLFEGFQKVRWNESKFEIIDINTNIYALYQKIKKLNEDFYADSTSTIEVLKEILESQNRYDDAQILNNKYPYIYLLFDFEYQDNHYDLNNKYTILNEMLNYFYDETENGLLLINYPMIESYRDCKEPLPDKNYINNYISTKDVSGGKYKEIVGNRGINKNVKSKFTIEMFEGLFFQNLIKTKMVIDGELTLPTYDEFMNYLEGIDVLEKQISLISDKEVIAVLCTCLFIFVSYFGKDYYENILEKFKSFITQQ